MYIYAESEVAKQLIYMPQLWNINNLYACRLILQRMILDSWNTWIYFSIYSYSAAHILSITDRRHFTLYRVLLGQNFHKNYDGSHLSHKPTVAGVCWPCTFGQHWFNTRFQIPMVGSALVNYNTESTYSYSNQIMRLGSQTNSLNILKLTDGDAGLIGENLAAKFASKVSRFQWPVSMASKNKPTSWFQI